VDASSRRARLVTAQVLVAGGGPVGLAAAVELGRRGIDCLVIEPRTVVSRLRPRCKTVNVRTMEHLRRWGLADRLRDRAPLPVAWSQDVVFATSLVGYELSRFKGVLGLTPDGDRFAEPGQQAPQYVLEELLREVVDDLPTCTLVTGARVVAVNQDADAVTTTVVDELGRRTAIRSEFVLGCDGSRSAVRAQIGSAYAGERALRPNFGMVFRAPDLLEQVRHGPAVQYWIVNRDAPALMGPLDLDGTWWIIAFGVDEDTGRREARRLIDAAAGRLVDATVVSDDPWTARMQLVDRLRCGRVFLAGDAAHLNPPFGGHGMNTGIGDAVDLGWKVAGVLQGWGGPGLLESYELERRPVQDRVIQAATDNMSVLSTDLVSDDLDAAGAFGDQARRRVHERIQATKASEFHALDLVLDVKIRASPVLWASNPSSPGADVGQPVEPGQRLPHLWLHDGHSLYDDLGEGLSLVFDASGDADPRPFQAAARQEGIPLETVAVRHPGANRRFGAGMLLVRPDQHVAWVGDDPPDDPLGVLDRVRGTVESISTRET
jgi:2-polyprenyl-6-methoxyphenol hydroxylase-like FAD-dependent oxidoreductase